MAAGAQLHFSGDKRLPTPTIPSLSHSLVRWQVAGGCQVCVGNLYSGAENVYCRERTFALWSHLLLVTSRFLIFYHRKFLVDHKSNPLSPAAERGGEAVHYAAGLSLSLQCGAEHLCPAKCKVCAPRTMLKWTIQGGKGQVNHSCAAFYANKKKMY